MHDPSFSQSRLRLGCLCGTFSPSRPARPPPPACRCPASPPVSATTPRPSGSRSGHTGAPARRCPPSAYLRHLAPLERAAASSGAVRACDTPDARTASAHAGRDRCTPGGARGLEVSPGGLRQDHLVQRQVGHRPPQPGVLRFQALELLDLTRLQPAELLAPPVIRHLGDADRSNGVRNRLALRRQDIHLAQLGDNLFRLVAFLSHRGPPPRSKTYFKVDQFSGGGSAGPSCPSTSLYKS